MIVRAWRWFRSWAVQEHTFCIACGDPADEVGPHGHPMCGMCAYLLAFQIAGNRKIRRARRR